MTKIRVLLAGVLLAIPMILTAAPSAHACTDTTDLDGCGKVNYVCQKVFKTDGNCVG